MYDAGFAATKSVFGDGEIQFFTVFMYVNCIPKLVVVVNPAWEMKKKRKKHKKKQAELIFSKHHI